MTEQAKIEPTLSNGGLGNFHKKNTGNKKMYTTIWRWHFYASIIFAPLILFLVITGGIYLFKPQIENSMYHDLYYVQTGEEMITPSEQINQVKMTYPNAEITNFTPSPDTGRTSVVEVIDNGQTISTYVNPYSGEIVGTLNENNRFMAFVKEMHNGELWGGTFGNRLVELAGCWTIILVVSGCYIWWPRNRKSIFGTLIPRIRGMKGKRQFWRDLHAVTAVWLSVFIVVQVLSGLMWSDVWGGMAHKAQEITNSGSPAGIYPWETYAFPTSDIPTKEVADVPWAAENLLVPESMNNDNVLAPISIENVIETAEGNQIQSGYNIAFPQSENGVYTVFLNPADVYPNRPSPWLQQTMHIDQYSGEVLVNYTWDDYGFLGKTMSLGIAFHQGEFGLISQFLMLLLMIGIVLIVAAGFVMWWKRRPKGKLGAPPLPKDFKIVKGLAIIIIALSLFFPLAGLSLLIVWLIDRFILRKIPRVKQWLG